MTRTRLSGLVVAALVRSGHADPLAVHVDGAPPFSTSQLEAALAVRAQLATVASAPAIDARVTADGADVQIALLDRTQRVSLDGQRGDDAARLVAFAILDLAGDRLDPPGAPVAAHDTESPLHDVAAVAPVRPHRELAWSLGAWAVGGTRNAASLELVLGVGPVHAIASAGAALAQTSDAVTRHAFPVRAGAGVAVGPVEVRATVLAVIERASAERTHTQPLFGGGAAVIYAVPRRLAGFTVQLGAGADAFATAIDYRINDAHVTTTPRLAWWGGLGIAREVWR